MRGWSRGIGEYGVGEWGDGQSVGGGTKGVVWKGGIKGRGATPSDHILTSLNLFMANAKGRLWKLRT